MALWNEFVRGALPYQEFWLPLLIGMAVGGVCVFVGSRVRRARRADSDVVLRAVSTYDPFVEGSLTDQRRSLRRPGNPVEVLYAPAEDRQTKRRAVVLDRSMGGLRLAAEQEVKPGARLFVLPCNATPDTPWIEIDVRTSRQVDDSWELGCQFVKTPQWSILLMFG